MKARHTDTDPGWINRKFARLEKMIRESAAAKRLQAATIGFGGLTVKDGGKIQVLYPDGRLAFSLASSLIGDVGQKVTMFQMLREDGASNIFTVWRIAAGSSDALPAGYSNISAGVNTLQMAATDQLLLGGPDSAVIVAQTGSSLLLSSANGVAINHTTTASAANCYIDPATFVIYRVSSSRRYKQDEADAEIDVDVVLQLVPREFRRRDEVEELGDEAPTYVGFIAEEAADLGLDHWVTSDDEGPESFAYANWPVALQAVARHQAQEISELKATVATLGQRLEVLENGG